MKSRFWEEIERDYGDASGPAGTATGRKGSAYWKTKISDRLWAAGCFREGGKIDRCGSVRERWCACCLTVQKLRVECMLKFCPDCAARRAEKLQAIYVPTISRVKWPLFVTFTIGGGDNWSLKDQLAAVQRGVKNIRRQRWFRNAVKGGVGSFELKFSKRGWHVHWHAVLDCKWLAVTIEPPRPFAKKEILKRKLKAAQKEVGEQWAMAVGISPSFVFIRRAKPATAQYVVKYSVKAADFENEMLPVAELVEEAKGAKLVAPWGSVRTIRRRIIEEAKTVEKPRPCQCEDGGIWTMSDLSCLPAYSLIGKAPQMPSPFNPDRAHLPGSWAHVLANFPLPAL
jgi:hypothetical protein